MFGVPPRGLRPLVAGRQHFGGVQAGHLQQPIQHGVARAVGAQQRLGDQVGHRIDGVLDRDSWTDDNRERRVQCKRRTEYRDAAQDGLLGWR